MLLASVTGSILAAKFIGAPVTVSHLRTASHPIVTAPVWTAMRIFRSSGRPTRLQLDWVKKSRILRAHRAAETGFLKQVNSASPQVFGGGNAWNSCRNLAKVGHTSFRNCS